MLDNNEIENRKSLSEYGINDLDTIHLINLFEECFKIYVRTTFN